MRVETTITLRPVRREDYIENFLQWANDPDFNRYLSHGLKTTTKEMMEDLYEDLSKKENAIFAIVDPKSEKTIGIVGLHQFNHTNKSVEYTIHIGEREFWGTGAASEATDYILNHAFAKLNMNKVWLGVNELNARAIKFYEKKGFRHEGCLRHEIIDQDGEYHDSLRMSLLRGEYDRK